MFLSTILHTNIVGKETDHHATEIPHCMHSHNVNNNRCQQDFFNTLPQHTDDNECGHVQFCQKEFNMLRFNIEPYSSRLEQEIRHLINLCCSKCTNQINVRPHTNATAMNLTDLKQIDFIFPVLARDSVYMLSEFYFIPLLEAPETYYVRRRRSGTETAADILMGLANLWPTLGIGILLALLAGFIVWFIDTWKNPEEFPRDFAPGVFEGFWWSMVTMATVGYGDRVPGTYQGRSFAILWMIVGIVITNVFTAEVTSVVIEKKTAPIFDMTGSTIGVLDNRLYDVTAVARAGGHVHVINQTDTIQGMTLLLKLLLSKERNGNEIDGFLVDKFTYYYYWEWSNKPGNEIGRELLYRTIRTDKSTKTKEFYYGILVKRLEDLEHLKHYFKMNWFQVETCLTLQINSLVGDLAIFEDHENFPPDDGFRDPWLSLSIFIVLFVCCFGVCYDLVRRMTSCKKSRNISIKRSSKKHFFIEQNNLSYKQ